MKLTIEQLADKVNEIISEKYKDNPGLVKDGRQSSVLSTRRIRDYITKGLIEKPVGAGREKWFDESHVNALVSIRLLQHNGLSDQYIKTSTESELLADSYNPVFTYDEYVQNDYPKNLVLDESNDDKSMQDNALDFLKSLQKDILPSKPPLISSANPIKASSDLSSLKKHVFANQSDVELLRSLNQSKYRQFNEYLVDEKLGVFLKVDSKTDMVLQKKLMETIKNEIINHNKENKND